MGSIQNMAALLCNFKHVRHGAVRLLLLLAGMSIVSGVHAHGIWFAPRVSQLALVYGVGSQDLEVAKRKSDIKSLQGYDEAWQPVETKLLSAGPLLLVDMENQPTAISAKRAKLGFWNRIRNFRFWNRSDVPNTKNNQPYERQADARCKN